MIILIMGQPRSGKSTIAQALSEQYSFPIMCTDKYRREWGFHEPWKGFSTEINKNKQNEFYCKLKEFSDSFENVIIEGSAINPKDRNVFNANINILVGRKNLSAAEQLSLTRKYDTGWTTNRSDEYLLKLFSHYIKYNNEWMNENKEIYSDTSDFKNINTIFLKYKKSIDVLL